MFSATANVFWKFLIRWDRIQGCRKLPWRGCNRFHPSRAYQVRFFLDPTRISRIIWNSSVRTGIWRSSWARDISFILFGCLLCNCVRGTQAIIFVSGVPTSTICNFVYLYFVKLTHYLLLWFQYAYSIHRAPLSFRRGNRWTTHRNTYGMCVTQCSNGTDHDVWWLTILLGPQKC